MPRGQGASGETPADGRVRATAAGQSSHPTGAAPGCVAGAPGTERWKGDSIPSAEGAKHKIVIAKVQEVAANLDDDAWMFEAPRYTYS
mmetsp:Transcript_2453/g.7075  ORF Transcript_2453/g.7075 Transcript_2453/m.7075 type:complete len:88 (+) Transcript_2453:112-375(+)